MTISRRAALALGAGALVAGPAGAHTPYRQWVVYRQKHLLIGAHRADMRTYELAKSVVAALAEALPDAAARVARGPRPQRIASLLATGQLLTAVLSREEAAAMAAAAPPFDGYRPMPLTQLAPLAPGYDLCAHAEFPDDHAWMVTRALSEGGLARPPAPGGLPIHPGAAAFGAHDPGD